MTLENVSLPLNFLPNLSQYLNKSVLLPGDVTKMYLLNNKQYSLDQMSYTFTVHRSRIICIGTVHLGISVNSSIYCPFDISWKTFFAWHFILNKNILFWLTISSLKPFVFYVSVFCSQIFTQKLKLWPKVGLTYAISIVKWFFGIFV